MNREGQIVKDIKCEGVKKAEVQIQRWGMRKLLIIHPIEQRTPYL
jgi:hypothetical protein